MADPVLELDAAASNVDGSNPGTSMLLVDSSTGWGLVSFDAPSPELKLLWTSSVDMDGSLRADPGNYENRTVTATLAVERSTAALCQAQLRILGHKMGKLGREGGTLKVTWPSGNTFIFDVLAGSHNFTFDHAFVMGNLALVSASFTCLPGARGAEQDLGDNTETTLPCLVFTEASIPGDLSALGRLVIDNDATANQWWLTWGIQSRYYSSSANAALFYEAEGRTLMGGSALSSSGSASGGGNNIVLSNPLLAWTALLSTQATGGGAHLSHVGNYRVYARVNSTGTGTYELALEWAAGDFLAPTRNTSTGALSETGSGAWVLLDLGMVSIPSVVAGTQRWEGRILGRTSAETISVRFDYLMLVPVTEGSGVVSGVQRTFTPTSYVGKDAFTGTAAAGTLNARVAPTGGTWATSGVATDFAFYDTDSNGTTNEGIQRSTTAEATPRLAILGTTNYTDVAISVRAMYSSMGSSGSLQHGLIAHWTDSSNYLLARFSRTTSGTIKTLEIVQVLAGVSTVFASDTAWPSGVASSQGYWQLYFTVSNQGFAEATVSSLGSLSGSGAPSEGTVMLSVSAQSSTWATGGTLATGEPGIYDMNSASSGRRDYDDFYVWVPPADAALFGSQSLEVRHDRVVREDSAGAVWAKVSSYEGDYLKIPPSGAESRTLRAIVKATRGEPNEFDAAIDDISARLFVTPRYLNVPSA
jgi:hypothetical protein